MTSKSNWNYPTTIWFGNGRIQEIVVGCELLGIKRPLFVTDEGLVNLDIVQNCLDITNQSSLTINTYSNVKGNPTGENVLGGLEIFNSGEFDGVIAFGGGSALDAAKTIAFMANQDRPLWDFEDIGDNWRRANLEGMIPVIAVPTTAGTGSEVGRAAVITDEEAKSKKIIFHPSMMPEIVIADPELTVGLPPNLTAWTGVDALTHSIEAFFAPGYHPMADGIAVEAIKLINKYLPVAYNDPTNLKARGQMLTASAMGAVAFQKGLGSIHSVAHQLGALYDVQHGLANAILLPFGIKQNASVLDDKANYLCSVLNILDNGVDGLINHLLDFRKQLGIPENLSEIGINNTDADRIGEMAFNDPSTPTNAKSVDASDLRRLFLAAQQGVLTDL